MSYTLGNDTIWHQRARLGKYSSWFILLSGKDSKRPRKGKGLTQGHSVTELGLKPKSIDSQSSVTFTVRDSKGIRKPLHHPDSPIRKKERKKKKEERRKKTIRLLNQNWYRNCSSGGPRQMWGTAISHVLLGQVLVRPHLPKSGSIYSYAQHEIIELLSYTWVHKKELTFQWVKQLSKQLIRELGWGAQGAAKAQRKVWCEWGKEGEGTQALSCANSAALIQRLNFLSSQPWGFIGVKYPSKLANHCQTKAMAMESLLSFFFTTDICHQCLFLSPVPSCANTELILQMGMNKLNVARNSTPRVLSSDLWLLLTSSPAQTCSWGTSKRKCWKWGSNRLLLSDSGSSIWLSIVGWEAGTHSYLLHTCGSSPEIWT